MDQERLSGLAYLSIANNFSQEGYLKRLSERFAEKKDDRLISCIYIFYVLPTNINIWYLTLLC